MSTEAWFRNPRDYIRELVECNQGNIAWDRGTIEKYVIDPVAFANLYYKNVIQWRALLVGEQGTAEYRNGSKLYKPVAVYPTWAYGDNSELLEEIIAHPVGEDVEVCTTPGVPFDELPVLGQEHRVVVTSVPSAASGPGRKFLAYLKELQDGYPDCIIHLHGPVSWRVAFGFGFKSADVNPRFAAAKGKIHLPNGKEIMHERSSEQPQWIMSLGFKPKDLSVPRNRCMYNIKSAVWAADNYGEMFNFSTRSTGTIDSTTPSRDYLPITTKSMAVRGKVASGDKFLCDTCSLAKSCKYYRAEAVCSLPGADQRELAQFFNTRDSGLIIEGLGKVLGEGARRLERGYKEEQELNELVPEVTKMERQVFSQGVQLAKLVDPSLRTSPNRLEVKVGRGSAVQINNGNPNSAISAVMRELQAKGIPLDQITPEMIQGVFETMGRNVAAQQERQVIEAKVIDANVIEAQVIDAES